MGNTSGELYRWHDKIQVIGERPATFDEQGNPLFIPGIWTSVQGCTPENREPKLINWWNVQIKALDFEIKTIPDGRKWCSQHPIEGRVDEILRESDPDRYWELKGWMKLDQFTNDPGKRGGKYPVCNQCRARHKRMLYALQKQERGETVRNYEYKYQKAG